MVVLRVVNTGPFGWTPELLPAFLLLDSEISPMSLFSSDNNFLNGSSSSSVKKRHSEMIVDNLCYWQDSK